MDNHEVISAYYKFLKSNRFVRGEHPTLGETRELVFDVIKRYETVDSPDEISDHLFADNINVLRYNVRLSVINLLHADKIKYDAEYRLVIDD
jgi:hypothetical protein